MFVKNPKPVLLRIY